MPIYQVKDRRTGKVLAKLHQVVVWYGAAKPKAFKFRGTKAEAEAFEARQRLELRAARPSRADANRTAPTFSEFCLEDYARHAEKYLGKGTRRNRNYQVAMLVELLGDTRLDRFSHEVVRWLQDQRLASGGIGPAKINDDVKVLITILNTASSLGVPVTVPQRARKPGMPGWRPLPVETKGRPKPYSEEAVLKLYRALGKVCPHLLGPTCAMLNTGVRRGEALILEWDWVDLKRGIILIQPNEFWRPKDNEPREVPIGDALLPWLTRKRQHPRWIFPTLPTPMRPQGDRYAWWPQNQWDEARALAGVGGSPHMCRHTYASHFLMEKPDLQLLAKVLGHSRTRTTELYAHFMPEHLAQARNVVSLPVPAGLAPKRTKAARKATVSRKRSGNGLGRQAR